MPHHGSTDGLILLKVLEHHGVAPAEAAARLPELQRAMVDHFMEHVDHAGDGLEVLPGVVALLEALRRRDDVAVCLVTGNLQAIGWAKMEALGIKRLFSPPCFGGFGSDFCSGDQSGMGWADRAELVRVAAARAEQHGHGPLGRRVHVGDAPMDVKAAAAAGAHPLGVTTGIYTAAQLEDACPAATVLAGLHDLPRVLQALGLV